MHGKLMILLLALLCVVLCVSADSDVEAIDAAVTNYLKCHRKGDSDLCASLFAENHKVSINGYQSKENFAEPKYWNTLFSKVSYSVISILRYLQQDGEAAGQFFVRLNNEKLGSFRGTFSNFISVDESGKITRIDQIISSDLLDWINLAVSPKKDRILQYLKLVRSVVAGDHKTFIDGLHPEYTSTRFGAVESVEWRDIEFWKKVSEGVRWNNLNLLATAANGDNEAFVFFKSSFEDLKTGKNITLMNAHHAVFTDDDQLIAVNRIVEEVPDEILAVLDEEKKKMIKEATERAAASAAAAKSDEL